MSLAALATVGLGIAFIAVLTWIVYIGIEVSARTQVILLAIELLALGAFAVVALARVASGAFPDGVMPTLEWLNPFLHHRRRGQLRLERPDRRRHGRDLHLLGLGHGGDRQRGVDRLQRDPWSSRGRSRPSSSWHVRDRAIAAQAVHGAAFLADQGEEDVLGRPGHDRARVTVDKLLILAVLTSAAASTQTTILPTARTALSMGAKRALPAYWAKTHPVAS